MRDKVTTPERTLDSPKIILLPMSPVTFSSFGAFRYLFLFRSNPTFEPEALTRMNP